MMDHFEASAQSYEQVVFESLNWYQLEALQDTASRTCDDVLKSRVKREIQTIYDQQGWGDEVFWCLADGLRRRDAAQMAWSMARIPHLIHDVAGAHLGTNKIRTPREMESQIGIIHQAENWIEGDKSEIPITFGSGTLAQRIYLRKDSQGQPYFSMPTDDDKYYGQNLPYYQAFLKLFDVDESELSPKGEVYYYFTRSFSLHHTQLNVNLDKDGIIHKFEIIPKIFEPNKKSEG
jgi:hypothetical protein